MTFAHIAGVPLEELLTLAPGAGVLLLALAHRVRVGARPSATRPEEP
jgi:hypothetical protein